MFKERFYEAVNGAEWQLIILAAILLERPLIAHHLANAISGISLTVAAEPYRFNLTSTEFSPETKSILPTRLTA